MENQSPPAFRVGEFIALTNQVLDGAFPLVEVEGEVASFKVNQGKFVFFDLKDETGSVGCFMMLFALRVPLEDGMRVVVRARPKLTQWGKFSLTVEQVRAVGEGALRRAYELLQAKLEKEGLFAPERKRPLPAMPRHIAVVSSMQSAGYADFMKIVTARWGGMQIDVAHVQVQGEAAADQMIRALDYINQQEQLPEVIVLIRGGGSADDLRAFNDERLVRAVAASRVPVLSGIGHEVDESLVDQAADVRASTPSNAAELLVPSRHDVRRGLHASIRQALGRMDHLVETARDRNRRALDEMLDVMEDGAAAQRHEFRRAQAVLEAFHPQHVLERGYAILRGEVQKGSMITAETAKQFIDMEVQNVRQK